MSILSVLSLFTLLTISSVTYFAAQRIKVPYTVLLVAVGLFLVPLSDFPLFHFLQEFTLTPELLFYIFLPILIFESAYNIPIRKIEENVWSISFLSVISLLISALFIAGALFFIFDLIGLALPFIVLLLFAALISATDPVAVLALFKEYGAPRRLSLIFEGESLFNDGTAVALFLIVLEIAIIGFHGVPSVLEGVFLFSTMVAGGILFGLFTGALFSRGIQMTRSNEGVSIMLMMVSAHITFILSEIISEHFVIYGQEIKFSSIIATTVAAMFIGNYGRPTVDSSTLSARNKSGSSQGSISAPCIIRIISRIVTTTRSASFGRGHYSVRKSSGERKAILPPDIWGARPGIFPRNRIFKVTWSLYARSSTLPLWC